MPLPAALLARLSKRGIVRRDGEEIEEVIAESYDDEKEMETQPVAIATDNSKVNVVFEIADCPNTSNKYHECNQYCKDHYGLKAFRHIERDLPKRDRLLKKYPPPSGWCEVGDPLTGRCYYWNTDTDKVSWLPPQHPKAKITVSAEKLKATMKAPAVRQDSSESLVVTEKKRSVSITPRENTKRKRREVSDELDPMDPASYSEVERGTWSTGLKADTKTGVDTTASGPLFQQRPYPSPGEILRANQAK